MALSERSMIRNLLLVVSLYPVVLGCGREIQDGSEYLRDRETTTSQVGTTLQALAAEVPTSIPQVSLGLPVVDSSTSDAILIKMAQQLVSRECCKVRDNGIWSPLTIEAYDQWRSVLGLGPGSLDHDLWQAIFQIPPPEAYFPIRDQRTGIVLPHNAVFVGDSEDPGASRFTVASFSEIERIRSWYRAFISLEEVEDWYWCGEVERIDNEFELWWWKRNTTSNGVVLKLIATQVFGGRVDIRVERTGEDVSDCSGTPIPVTTTDAPDSALGGSSNGSGDSLGGSCYVGMNLEECEDVLGYGLAERMITFDCTREGRSVLWARNWWIIGFSDGYPVISKSRNSCS